MFLRRLKHMLLRLSTEEKAIGIGSLAVVFGTFMPWYKVVLNFEKGVTESGFSGDMGVLGFVVFLFTLIVLGFLVADNLGLKLPRFGFSKESLLLFFSGESAFLLLLAAAIFTKRSLDYTNAELRFGLYTALVGSILSAFASFALTQKLQKKEAKAFFEHDDESVGPEQEEMVEEKPQHKPAKAKKAEQEKFFEEVAAPVPAMEAFEAAPETMAEEEPRAEKALVEEAGLAFGLEPEAPASMDQANFFMKEADLSKVDEPKEKTAETPHSSSGFYNDL